MPSQKKNKISIQIQVHCFYKCNTLIPYVRQYKRFLSIHYHNGNYSLWKHQRNRWKIQMDDLLKHSCDWTQEYSFYQCNKNVCHVWKHKKRTTKIFHRLEIHEQTIHQERRIQEYRDHVFSHQWTWYYQRNFYSSRYCCTLCFLV